MNSIEDFTKEMKEIEKNLNYLKTERKKEPRLIFIENIEKCIKKIRDNVSGNIANRPTIHIPSGKCKIIDCDSMAIENGIA